MPSLCQAYVWKEQKNIYLLNTFSNILNVNTVQLLQDYIMSLNTAYIIGCITCNYKKKTIAAQINLISGLRGFL